MSKSIYFIAAFALFGCNPNTTDDKKIIRDSSFEVIALCDNPELRKDSSEIQLNFNKQITSYDVTIKKSKDNISIDFFFVSECCQEFDMQHIVRNKTVKLIYLPKEDSEQCDCFCDYHATYDAIDSEIDFAQIKNVLVQRGKRTN